MKIIRGIVLNPFTLVFVVYYFIVSFINPFTDTVINDEWAHTRQVEAFLHHSWRIQSNTDASLILLAFTGFFYALFLGYSLLKLKVLIFISSFVLLFFLYKTIRIFTSSYKTIVLTLLTIAVNPLFLHLGSTFMTDIPFLSLLSVSVYYYIRSIKEDKRVFSIIAAVITGLSVLIRQGGVFIFASWVVFKIIEFFNTGKNIKIFLSQVWKECLIFTLFFTMYVLYPRFGGNAGQHVISKLLDPELIRQRLTFLINSLIYLSYFLAPLIIFFKSPVKKICLPVTILLSFLPAFYIYKKNVFPTGNILFLEGMYSKSSQFFGNSLINNSLFKLLLSLIIGWIFIKVVMLLTSRIKQNIKDKSIVFLLILSFIYYLSLALPNDQYDRYTLPLFYILLLIFSINYSRETKSINHFSLILKFLPVLLIFFINYFLVYEFYSNNNLRWAAAKSITGATGLKSKIFVNGAYSRYISAQKIKDYSGELYVSTQGQYDCAAETIYSKYSENNKTENTLFKYSRLIENKIGKPDGVALKIPTSMGVPRAKDYQREVFFEKRYPSVFYNWYGYNVKVQGWCDKRRL